MTSGFANYMSYFDQYCSRYYSHQQLLLYAYTIRTTMILNITCSTPHPINISDWMVSLLLMHM